MKALVIGAGMMGSAAAYDLANSEGVTSVIVADQDGARAKHTADSIGRGVVPLTLSVGDHDGLLNAMRRVDVTIGATSYTHNEELTRAAIHAGIHFCDLGGNMGVVDRQLLLDADAKSAGVCILPNCGLAPGMACVIAAGAADKFSTVEEIHIRVGGLPQQPRPPLNYQLVFSAEGLLNEYLEPAEVLLNGELKTVPSMEELESLVFPAPFGTLEAFTTSGGVSTLTRMFRGKVNRLDYKTIRYPGHCEKFRTLLDLGFGSAEPIIVGSTVKTAREIFEELLRRKLQSNGPDVVLMRVTVRGILDGKKHVLAYEMVDHYDTSTRMTSMMRTTSFPTSVIAQLLCNGVIPARGVLPPEQCVPLEPFLEELRKRNIIIEESVH